MFFVLNSKQNPGKPVGPGQVGIFQIRWVYFLFLLCFLLLDTLKMYKIASFFYIERGIIPFPKMLGQKVLLSWNPLLPLFFQRRKFIKISLGPWAVLVLIKMYFLTEKTSLLNVAVLGMALTLHRHTLARFSNCKGIKSSNSLKFRREAFCFLGDAGPRDSDPQGMKPGEQTAINFDKNSPSLVLGKFSVGKKTCW